MVNILNNPNISKIHWTSSESHYNGVFLFGRRPDSHDLFLLKTVDSWFLTKCAWSVHKSAVKTFDDRFARCENTVWILFKSMLGSSFPPPPPPLILVLHEKPPFLDRDWKQCARAVCYPLSCFSLSSFAGPPEKRDYLKISTRDSGITVLGSQLTGLARLLYNHKVDFCCV